jgi:hypothetical protein
MATIRLNAFDKDSSGSYSETVEVSSLDELKAKEKVFDGAVPFTRFYFDHEVLECNDEAIEQYCDELI